MAKFFVYPISMVRLPMFHRITRDQRAADGITVGVSPPPRVLKFELPLTSQYAAGEDE